MEHHQIRYVIEVANYLNFSKAATKLFVTQPTITQQIAKLEKELSVKLFERKTRAVKLTIAGRSFVKQAKKVIIELEKLEQLMQDYSLLNLGEIKIGILTNIITQNLVEHLPEFQSLYPGINIKIIEVAGSQDLLNLLKAGSIDIAYLLLSQSANYENQIIFYPVKIGQVVIIAAQCKQFSGARSIQLAELVDEVFILPPNSHSIYDDIYITCRKIGFEPKVICECGQINTVFNLVAKGFGLAFISSQLADNELPGNIKIVNFEPAIERTLAMAILEEKNQIPIIKAFREFILNVIASKAQNAL